MPAKIGIISETCKHLATILYVGSRFMTLSSVRIVIVTEGRLYFTTAPYSHNKYELH